MNHMIKKIENRQADTKDEVKNFIIFKSQNDT